ncbi:MscS Mechanosensitive ion channel [Arcobacter nitrofigilis DSM 7299]|uniref:MscS Mechanosensitive ion channel n=1 Tax=Arcobacter nitrofigilis (strain ATCC 33309 / DSM 7299 / CCUG 15893 / LMG 7604 / NCTC 12251 / CI) TaxID=572480 RepID=D5V280_ARCNC|nr:mechanosensitive ion channel domain-containing protein [Arcobacter nitrofigilis]ADG92313.1 MscS Mechanosensitive ion channel [Arcobacter nitrofigilis DSM 7299]
MGSSIETVSDMIGLYSLNIAMAILIFVVGKWLARKLTDVVAKILRKNPKLDVTLVNFFDDIIYYVLLVVVVLTALQQIGVESTSFLAIIGAAGLAVGLALKDSLSNFASGVMIIFFKPFRIGDYVTAGGVSGTITEVHLFNTEFTTPDNQRVLVPNGAITAGSITNVNAHPKRRVDLVIGVGYGDNLKIVKDIITKIIESNDKVLKDEAITVAVSELGDSSVNFVVRAWVNTPDFWAVKWALIEEIKNTFDKEGISIPFPQRDVHIINEKN